MNFPALNFIRALQFAQSAPATTMRFKNGELLLQCLQLPTIFNDHVLRESLSAPSTKRRTESYFYIGTNANQQSFNLFLLNRQGVGVTVENELCLALSRTIVAATSQLQMLSVPANTQ